MNVNFGDTTIDRIVSPISQSLKKKKKMLFHLQNSDFISVFFEHDNITVDLRLNAQIERYSLQIRLAESTCDIVSIEFRGRHSGLTIDITPRNRFPR